MAKTKGTIEKQQLQLISRIGERFGYTLHWDPDQRGPCPIAMLELLGYVDAAEELNKWHRYPK